MYVTYSDLIQIGLFIVALIGLFYEIFKEKQPSLFALVTAASHEVKLLVFG